MVTVISPSGSGGCSCDPHQSLTLRPRSHSEISRDEAQQVRWQAPHLSSVALEGRSASPSYPGPSLCFRNEYHPTISISGNSLIFISLQHFIIFVFEYKATFWDDKWWFYYVCLTSFVSLQIWIKQLYLSAIKYGCFPISHFSSKLCQ